MANTYLLEEISDQNFQVDKFVELVLNDESIRSMVVDNMLTNPKIMIYYHCYYIIQKASEENPKLFYSYWDDFKSLLDHKNSYHRDFAINLISNLINVDEDDLFIDAKDSYLSHLNDSKFMTSECLVNSLDKIIISKRKYEKEILDLLIDIDSVCSHSEKQKELLKSSIINVFDKIYMESPYQEKICNFVQNQIESISPKTRKIAKGFIKKHKVE